MSKICSTCSCIHDFADWCSLPLKGYVGAVQSGGRRHAVELRDCRCGNTMGLEVEVRVQDGRTVTVPATIPTDAAEVA